LGLYQGAEVRQKVTRSKKYQIFSEFSEPVYLIDPGIERGVKKVTKGWFVWLNGRRGNGYHGLPSSIDPSIEAARVLGEKDQLNRQQMSPLLQTGLWISHPILEVMVAAIMFTRNRHRQFPIFFTYLAAQVAMFCVLFPIRRLGSGSAYFYSYWVFAGISLVLGFKVIYEIFQDVFRPYDALKDLGAMLFKWSGLVMLLAAVVIAAASPSSRQDSVIEAMMITQRGVRVIHCGLILFLLVFSKHLGISWKQNSFGIALGFGFYAAVELGTFALFSSGRETEALAGLITSSAYCVSIGVWLCYAIFKAFPREISANLLTSQRWNQSLGDLQNPGTGDSLIPMFEGMVDRAFSRTPGKFMTSYAAETRASQLNSHLKIGSSPLLSQGMAAFPSNFSVKF
jgi:hypothetical protein